MDIEQKQKILKDFKTCGKLAKQVKTMLDNVSITISEETQNSDTVKILHQVMQLLENGIDYISSCESIYKNEYKIRGYQITIFDVINENESYGKK